MLAVPEMRLLTILLIAAPLILGYQPVHQQISEPSGLCEIILNAPVVVEHVFDPDFIDTSIDPRWVHLSPHDFQALHARDMLENDTAWVVGKIPIRGTRVGLLVLNSSPECDHAVRYMTLHLFDGCSMLPHSFFLVESDSHVGVYERSGRFTANNDTLALSVREGEAGAEGVDTVFIRTDWIRLAPTIDTTRTETGFEVQP